MAHPNIIKSFITKRIRCMLALQLSTGTSVIMTHGGGQPSPAAGGAECKFRHREDCAGLRRRSATQTLGGHRDSERKAIVQAGDWEGPAFQTCQSAPSVYRAFETSRQREVLSFKHHAEVAALPAWLLVSLFQGIEGRAITSRSMRSDRRRRSRRARGWPF